MFQFIPSGKYYVSLCCTFKYISCSNLSLGIKEFAITSDGFKYISCSNLSTATLNILYSVANSNTSHVPIYLKRNAQLYWDVLFKYISCSNLSVSQKHLTS